MIQRIVKLSFIPEKINDFLEIYNKHLMSMQGNRHCNSLELLSDKSSEGSFFTYSTWISEDGLEEYRSSDYFKKIWSTIKPWFAEKPQAWTLVKHELK